MKADQKDKVVFEIAGNDYRKLMRFQKKHAQHLDKGPNMTGALKTSLSDRMEGKYWVREGGRFWKLSKDGSKARLERLEFVNGQLDYYKTIILPLECVVLRERCPLHIEIRKTGQIQVYGLEPWYREDRHLNELKRELEDLLKGGGVEEAIFTGFRAVVG